MPERLECEVLQKERYINPLTYLHTYLPTYPSTNLECDSCVKDCNNEFTITADINGQHILHIMLCKMASNTCLSLKVISFNMHGSFSRFCDK